LNSDTQVTAGWLDTLAVAAYSDPRIATVTPFSNNATICSLPRSLAENTIPAGHDLDSFAALIARVSQRAYPRLPTGVGACLYVKRSVIEEIGLFDEAFGLGYGEEIDFCLRAAQRGYHHVLDDATYIFHEGSRSFGRERARRVRRAHRVLRARHPTYLRTIAAFIREDPIAPARARVIAALQPASASAVVFALDAPAASATLAVPGVSATPSAGGARAERAPRRILHLVHGWPPWAHGGTELYAQWLAHHQRARGGCGDEVSVYARIADTDRALGDAVEHLDRGVRVRLIVNNFTQRTPICRAGLHCARIAADFRAFLDDVRPDVLHVHHLAGHCVSLLAIARRRGIPIVYQAQDWWPICARVNFVDRKQELCSGPSAAKCARCLPMTGLPGASLTNPLLYAARRRWMRAQLAHADAFVMGSRFIAESYHTARILPASAPVHVLTYGVPQAPPMASAPPAEALGAPLRFGYIGALLPHKGVHVAVEAFSRIAAQDAQLHVWGVGDNAAYRERLIAAARGAPGVVFHGAFPESEKSALLRTLDVLIVPSIGLESFGIAAREAMAHGVPVIASRRGALIELFDQAQNQAGALFAPGHTTELAQWVVRLIEEPDLLAQWRQALPSIKSVATHADELERVYDEVMRPRSR
jgi:glycosyltransferase involved in cell wall biosynthesis